MAEFEKESANVRAAWYYALETRQFAELDQGADDLGRLYLWRRRYHEGETATRLAEESLLQALASESSNGDSAEIQRILAKIQLWQSVFSDREKANELIGQALLTLDSPELLAVETRNEKAFGLQRAGDLAFDIDSATARQLYRRSLALYRELDDAWGISKGLTALGWVAAHSGHPEEAQHLGEEALALSRVGGDRKRTADALWLLGTLAGVQGQVEESSRLLGENLDIRATLGIGSSTSPPDLWIWV